MDGTEILTVWLSQLGDTRTERPTGAPLPFRTVRRIGGPSDGLTDHGLYSVATYASTETEAHTEGVTTHRRVCLLAGHGEVSVTVPTGVVYVDDLMVMDGPITTKWTDTVYRSVATYQVDLRLSHIRGALLDGVQLVDRAG